MRTVLMKDGTRLSLERTTVGPTVEVVLSIQPGPRREFIELRLTASEVLAICTELVGGEVRHEVH